MTAAAVVGLLTAAVTGLLPPANAVLTGVVTDDMAVLTGVVTDETAVRTGVVTDETAVLTTDCTLLGALAALAPVLVARAG